jgi:hypothetical protein
MAMQSRATVEIELAKEILRSFGELQFAAHGTSMIPTIFPGDILIIARDPHARVRCGQLVLASRDGRFFAHRVVGKTNAGGRHLVFTRGDALTVNDPPVADADLLGRVTAIIRWGRRIEIEETRPKKTAILQWAVRRWAWVAGLLLLWNSLRAKIARDSVPMTGQQTEGLAECSDER